MDDPQIRKARIMVVDRHNTSLRYLSNTLRYLGAAYSATSDINTALAQMKSARQENKPYNMALIDVSDTDDSGIKLACLIKSDSSLAQLKLIALTSVAHQNDPQSYKSAGFESCITKPVRKAALQTCILSMISGNIRVNIDIDTNVECDKRFRMDTQHSRILVVDDNTTNLDVAVAILKKLGYMADVAHGGRDAIQAVTENSYDLVLMDCLMPETDGYQATSEIRQLDPENSNPNIKIIAMTACAMQGDREKCLTAGMDDYITKPVNSKHLAAILDQWLDNPAETGDESKADNPNDGHSLAVNSIERAAEAAPIDERAVLNTNVLMYLLEGDKELVIKFIDRFYQDTLQRMNLLTDAVENSKLDIIKFQAHAIAGASMTVGAEALGYIAKKVETASDGGELLLVKDLLPQMIYCVEQFAAIVG